MAEAEGPPALPAEDDADEATGHQPKVDNRTGIILASDLERNSDRSKKLQRPPSGGSLRKRNEGVPKSAARAISPPPRKRNDSHTPILVLPTPEAISPVGSPPKDTEDIIILEGPSLSPRSAEQKKSQRSFTFGLLQRRESVEAQLEMKRKQLEEERKLFDLQKKEMEALLLKEKKMYEAKRKALDDERKAILAAFEKEKKQFEEEKKKVSLDVLES